MEIKSEMFTRDFLKSYIDAAKTDIFSETYAKDAKDSETIGILIAQYFKWDGAQVLDAMQSALEESNFHSFNARLGALRNEMEV
jgi:hypothetical protein